MLIMVMLMIKNVKVDELISGPKLHRDTLPRFLENAPRQFSGSTEKLEHIKVSLEPQW